MSSPQIKYQIFVSSTYKDLIEERKSVVETVLRTHNFPIGMEMFNANDKEQWLVIQDTIDLSDIYILIIGHKYGSLTIGKRKISFTQKEFEYALKRKRQGKLKILCFIRQRVVQIDTWKTDETPYGKMMLTEFIETVKKSRLTTAEWDTKDNLGNKVVTALSDEIRELNATKKSNPGWIKREFLDVSPDNATARDHTMKELSLINNISSIYDLLFETSLGFEIEYDDLQVYRFDDKCNCIIDRTRTQFSINDVTHCTAQYIGDKDGISEVKEIINLSTYAKSISYVIFEQRGNTLKFFLLFDKVIKAGEKIKYRSRVRMDGYLANLIEERESSIEYGAFPNTTFKKKKEIFIFPNTKVFNGLKVYLLESTSTERKEILPVINNEILTFTVSHMIVSDEARIEFKLTSI